MKKCEKQKRQASRKAENKKQRQLAAALPIGQYLAEARVDVEAFAAGLGPTVMRRIMEEEIQSQAGAWGKQTAHRHGHQAGYVVYAGRKVALSRPRLRRDDQEVRLARYQAFQKNGKLQQAVARHLTRQCSTRDYEGAIEQCLKGYGIKRSSVSRHWKAATTHELQQLMERAVPADLLVLMIDSKFFAGQCIPAAIGIDVQGKKHVLGLWHGATESAAVVKGLLEDLVARGLDSERKILVVIDGAKALRKAVQMVLGENGLVQRCRLHKERNVLDQLPREKQAQARWRLRGAWNQKDPKTAEKELRKTARWLEESWPMAAASLREGLEETLPVQRLEIGPALGRCLSNTNLMEGCFAQAAHRTRRVKHWSGAQMMLRWSASALLAAEKNFRRLNGCEQLKDLEKILREPPATSTLKAA
jgi:putative transposase